MTQCCDVKSQTPTQSEGPSGDGARGLAHADRGQRPVGVGRRPLTELFKEGLHEAGPRVEVCCVHIQVGDFLGCEEWESLVAVRGLWSAAAHSEDGRVPLSRHRDTSPLRTWPL